MCFGIVWINFENTFGLINGLLILLREDLALGEIITTSYLKVLACTRLSSIFIFLELIYGSEVFGRCINVVLVLEELVSFLFNLIGFLQDILDN